MTYIYNKKYILIYLTTSSECLHDGMIKYSTLLNIVNIFFSLEFVTFIKENKVGKSSFSQMKCYASMTSFFFRFPEPGVLASGATDTSA